MKKILFLIVALASMLTCLFYAFDSSFFQNQEIESEKIEESKSKIIYDADYNFSEPLTVTFKNETLEEQREIKELHTLFGTHNNNNFALEFYEESPIFFSFNLLVYSDTLESHADTRDCGGIYEYKNIFQKIILDRKNKIIGDSINVALDMIFVRYEEEDGFRDTLFVKGSIKTKIEDFDYSRIEKLKEFELNQLRKVHKQNPDTVINIYLGSFNLSKLPDEIFLFDTIKDLYLYNNSLSVEELNRLSSLKYLESLYITENNLKVFPKELLKLKSLKVLDISDNELKKIPKEIYKLEKLEILEISNNSISQLPSQLKRLKKLHTLLIEHNKFSKFPEVVYKMNNLKKIRIYGNEIENIKLKLDKIKGLEKHDYSEL